MLKFVMVVLVVGLAEEVPAMVLVAEAAVTKDTGTLGTIGTTVLEVQVVDVASGMPEEVQGELLISGTVPFSLRKVTLSKVLGVQTIDAWRWRREATAPKSAEDRELARDNKAARKKEKLTGYRCGVPGHFVMDCTTVLCDICEKPGHDDAACPLLLAPKLVINIYGVCQNRLMFFETPKSTLVLAPPRLESSRTGLVKVTNGTLTAEQVSQQLRRLVSETYEWASDRVDEQSFQVEFPRREDLQRLLTFGVSRVSGSKCLLEFEECKKPEPHGIRLKKVWIKFPGIPETLLNDFLIVWSLGSLIGKTEKVDMPFTRKRGVARLLVMVLDVEFIPDFAPWSYDGVHYDLDVEVEADIQPKSNDGDVHMTDGDERDRDQGDANKDKYSHKSNENIKPASCSPNDKTFFSGVAPSSSTSPMATLRFESFQVIHDICHTEGKEKVIKEFQFEVPHSVDVCDPATRTCMSV
ncbi:hypothetical protein D1007_17234 [Hordeum vulgare]|nr:hypothetical protein D1007_17234 [Hordeum vulgare]